MAAKIFILSLWIVCFKVNINCIATKGWVCLRSTSQQMKKLSVSLQSFLILSRFAWISFTFNIFIFVFYFGKSVELLNGILDLLDDETKLSGMSSQNFSQKVENLRKSHSAFRPSTKFNSNGQEIVIRHFARNVVYSTVSENNNIYF